MNNNDLIPLLKDKVKMFEKSEAFKSGCSFSDYLYDYYSEHGYNIPSGLYRNGFSRGLLRSC